MQTLVKALATRLCALALLVQAAALAAPPASGTATDFDRILTNGFELERAGQWRQAIELYQDAVESHPNSLLLEQRIRQCRIHYSLTRRYQDNTYRSRLLRLPATRAWKLYDEVVEKVDAYYVDPPDYTAMFRSGVEHLLVACEDDVFRKTNMAGASLEQVAQFRQELYRWKDLRVADRWEQRRHAARLTGLAESRLGLRSTPVLLELIYGMFDALDRYSSCLTPGRLNDLYAVIDGNFVGIGVELRSDELGLRVVTALVGGPAAEAGIRRGDVIVAVDSVPTAGLSLEEAANRLQGEAGTAVELWVLSPGGERPRRIRLTRRAVEVRSVSRAEMLSPAEGIGYVQLSAFQKTTARELEQAVQRLQRQGLRGLVLDLRGNPGGLLSAAIDICDRFLDGGIIVITRGRAIGQSYTYRASRPATWRFPLVLLIDGDSASASEIVAGAIQENHRGTVVGQRSFGKGSVQSIYPLDTASAGLRLTTAHFYSPTGRRYELAGVAPDIKVPHDPDWHPDHSPFSPLNPAGDAQLAAAMRACRQLIGRR